MKIAHLPFVYYPDAVGGTEVYVQGLVREQIAAGHQAFIIAPAAEPATYQHEGVTVHRYRVDDAVSDITEMYSADASVDAAGFLRIMEAEAPDILHVHGYTRAVSRKVLEAVKAQGIRIVFTYHTPTATCVRGTLMRWGTVTCDGTLNAVRCAACSLQARGVPRLASEVIARLPQVAGRMFTGRMATGMRMRELVELRHAGIRHFLECADRVIAPSDWVADVLRTIGVPANKIVLNRQGTRTDPPATPPPRAAGHVRLAFFGRIDRTKGLDVILDALAAAPDLKVELDVYGIVQTSDAYAREIERRAASDERVRILAPVPQEMVAERLARYDAVVIPSQWLETGPLTVLEAFAAGLPVIGSRLGGIAELVRDGVDGILVDPRNANAWVKPLRRITEDPAVLHRLRAGVVAPRTTTMVARDMDSVYRAVLAHE